MVGAGVRVDDFVMPPLDGEEFRTRIGRILWAHTGADEGSLLRRRGLVIDLERYTVSVDGEVVDLTYKEYELLRFLATNAGKPFTREALLNRVWGYDYYGGSRTVDVHIRRIRAKIERHEAYIDTVRNVGYRFIDDTPIAGRLEAITPEGL
jgi:DNA-binding response OmpR family regulator